MRIAHWIDEPYDSGIVHYALAAARGLEKAGHEIEVWARPGLFPILEAGRLGLRTREVDGVTALWALRADLARKPVDLVNAHTGASHTLAAALAGSLPKKVAVVRTRADARPVRRGPTGLLLWKRTAGFIAPSRTIEKQFHEAFPEKPCPVSAVYPGIEAPPASPEPEIPHRVGIVARLDPVKGHHDFLRAAALVAEHFPRARFLIAGREENVKRRQLEALASNLGVCDRIEFLGHVPDVPKFMRSCHVGVVASTGSEAVSRVAIEWMAAGRPVLATSVGCLPEFVESGGVGELVPPHDPRAMAAALRHLLGDAALRRRLGDKARERYESTFALPRFARETEGFYERTLRALPSR